MEFVLQDNKTGLNTVNLNFFEIYLIIIMEFILRHILLHAEKRTRSTEGKFYLGTSTLSGRKRTCDFWLLCL